ncbi:unnamed protein product [Ectocarpus sp. CCAP 1310/34]|nr:unnamed protein product [Ectocarpus sp. CCAP 1310/34]
MSDLGGIFKDMITASDPDGTKMQLSVGEGEGVTISRWVEQELNNISEITPIGRSTATFIEDNRTNPVLVYPYIHSMAQIGSLVGNLHADIETARAEVRRLKRDLAHERGSNASNKPADIDTVRLAAGKLREGITNYSSESQDVVFNQKHGRAPLAAIDPLVEWRTYVPPLMVDFLNELGYQHAEVDVEGDA